MSLMVGSLSNGSSGPRPVISSRISETKSPNSWVLRGRRSTSTYCETSCWTWRRISSSGALSSAERLISSIKRLCRRTLASSSLSLRSGLSDCCAAAPCSLPESGKTVQDTPSSSDEGGSSGAGASGVAARRAVKRPTILAYHRNFEFFQERHWRALAGRFRRRIQHEFLELSGDLVAGLDLVERNAAVDRLPNKRVVVGNCAQESVAKRLRKVAAAQTGVEHFLGETVDNYLRVWSLAQTLSDRRHKLLGVAQAWNGGFADDEQLVRAEQNAVGPREPCARHVENDVFEIGGYEVEQPRYDVGIERTHLGRPVRRGNDRETGRMIREHHFQQLPIETIWTRLDFRKVETRLKIEIVRDRAMLKVEVDEAGRRLRARATAVKQDHRGLHSERRHSGTADSRQKCVDLGIGRFGTAAGTLGHACAGADQI